MIRVVLVDDHPVVRAGMRALVESQADLSVVGEASDAVSAVEVVTATHPGVVLMDLQLGEGPDGIEVTRRLRALAEPPQVLVLTTFDTEADILAAIQAGAAGYLLKDAPPEEIYRAVRGTARGEVVLGPTISATLVRRTTARGTVLTEREVDVIGLLARGLTNKQMAMELFVSEATVKSHLSQIYSKLGVDTRAGAVAKALDQHIIRL